MDSEIFPVVDTDGNVIGRATRGECHSGSMLLHPVVHLHVIDHNGRVFLQRRSMNKDIQPGRWDTAVGGHIDWGETVSDALYRECREELGIVPDGALKLATYIFESDRERELINAFGIVVDADAFNPVVDPVEIDEARFWSIDEINNSIGHGILTPNFEGEFKRLLPELRRLLS